MLADIPAVELDQPRPAATGQLARPLQPVRRELVADVVRQKLAAPDPAGLGKPQQSALFGDEAAVEVIELFDEVLDPDVVETHPFQQFDDFRFELVVAAFGYPRQRRSLDQRGNPLVLHLVDFFVRRGDRVEDRHHARRQLRFHRGQRNRAFLALAVLAVSLGLDVGELGGGFLALGGLRFALGFGGRRCLEHRRLGFIENDAAVGRVEIDDVAQQHLVFVERVAPAQQRAHGQRALADAADHHVAAGLDALGDGDLALARQQLDRTHLAQIHAYRIVGAADIVVIDIAAHFAFAILGLGLGGLFAFLALDDVDAELGQHRHRVLDLLGRHLVLRQRGVQLVIGQVAALLAAQHHLLDGEGDRVEEWGFGRILPGFGRICCSRRFARHSVVPLTDHHKNGHLGCLRDAPSSYVVNSLSPGRPYESIPPIGPS